MIAVGLGSIFPLYASATGRVCLAHLPHELTVPLLARELGAAASSAEVQRELRRNRAEVLERGYALMIGHFVQQIRSLAASVFDGHGDLVAVMALVGPMQAQPTDQPELATLLEISRNVSRQLGLRPKDSPKR